MTEAEWLGCLHPKELLECIHERASRRKIRLFAVALCRRALRSLAEVSLGEERLLQALAVAEQFADRQASSQDVRRAREAVRAVLVEEVSNVALDPLSDFAYTAFFATAPSFADPTVLRVAMERAAVADAFAETWKGWLRRGQYRRNKSYLRSGANFRRAINVAIWDTFVEQASQQQCVWLRDLFGNPFRPATIHSSCLRWNDRSIPKLAQSIYKDHAFDRLPVLGDALEEAGCTNADILSHCRQPEEHFRGCWVVDLILGKK
jgi:hypothetical protein